jgi:hypothetical protein
LEKAFAGNDVIVLGATALGINASLFKKQGSRTKVRKVFLTKAQKENVILQGTASAVVNEFLDQYQRKISTAIGKSIEGKKLNDEE